MKKFINDLKYKIKIMWYVLLGHGVVYNMHFVVNGEFGFVNHPKKRLCLNSSIFEAINNQERLNELEITFAKKTMKYIPNLKWESYQSLRGIKVQKYNAAICVPPAYTHHQAFDEIGLGLSSALKELGLHDPNGRNIVLGAHLAEGLPDDAIIWNLEQIMVGSPWLTKAYVDLMKKHTVFDYSYQNIIELKKLGIEAKFLGIGYQPELTKIPTVEPDIDVVFAGSLNDRRKKILDQLSKSCSVGIAPGYGEQRDKVYARAKICINMHYYDSKVFELVRCSYLMSNSKCIISETGTDTELEKPFENAVQFCSYDKLVKNCLDTLERDNWGTRGWQGFHIFSKLKQSDYLKAVL